MDADKKLIILTRDEHAKPLKDELIDILHRHGKVGYFKFQLHDRVVPGIGQTSEVNIKRIADLCRLSSLPTLLLHP